jgi:hypothetical protein
LCRLPAIGGGAQKAVFIAVRCEIDLLQQIFKSLSNLKPKQK